jgi:hypothetical protein
MRVTSDFWCSAYIRRCHGTGLYALVRRKGEATAGAIFIVVDRLDRQALLLGPGPQGGTADNERVFTVILGPAPEAEIEERLARELRFDPDIWVLAVEDAAGRHLLDLV